MGFKKMIQYVPLGILIIAIVYCIYTVITTDTMLLDKHYVGIALVIMSGVCYVFIEPKPRVGKIATLITLLLGTGNVIAFTPVVEAYSFGFSINSGGLDFKIQPFSFMVLLLFTIVNIKSVGRLINKGNKD